MTDTPRRPPADLELAARALYEIRREQHAMRPSEQTARALAVAERELRESGGGR